MHMMDHILKHQPAVFNHSYLLWAWTSTVNYAEEVIAEIAMSIFLSFLTQDIQFYLVLLKWVFRLKRLPLLGLLNL